MLNYTINELLSLYSCTRDRGIWNNAISKLTGRSRGLLFLADVYDACTLSNYAYAGIRTVPIDQIRGSEGRRYDFDQDFNPTQDNTKQRWLNIAMAWQQGKSLPLIKLTQIGDVYFVRDGHHRISVAQAFGQMEIEAKVTVLRVSDVFPPEILACAQHVIWNELGIVENMRRLWDGGLRLLEDSLINLSDALFSAWKYLKTWMVINARLIGSWPITESGNLGIDQYWAILY